MNVGGVRIKLIIKAQYSASAERGSCIHLLTFLQ